MKSRFAEKLDVIRILLSKYGIIGFLRVLWSDVLFDFRHGVDTYAPVSKEELFSSDRLALQNRYVPSTFAVVDAGINKAKELLNVPLQECGFIDYGSGKGKVLIASARHGFKRNTGIEYSQELHDIAVSNIQKLGLQNQVDLVRGDAMTFFPKPDDLVLYFFNPFMGEILEACLRNIVSVKPIGRRILILFNPVEDERMGKFFTKVFEGSAQPGTIRFCVYEG